MSCVLVLKKKNAKLGTSIVQRRLRNRDRRAKLLCFKSKPFAFLSFSCPSPSSLLKLPNVYRLFVRREKKKWLLSGEVAVSGDSTTDCFHSRCRQLCKFISTKESFYIRKKSNPQRLPFLVHLHGRCFIVLYTIMASMTSTKKNLANTQPSPEPS